VHQVGYLQIVMRRNYS